MKSSIATLIFGLQLCALTVFAELEYSIDRLLDDVEQANKTHLPTALSMLEEEYGKLADVDRSHLDQMRLMAALSGQYIFMMNNERAREVIENALAIPLSEDPFEQKFMLGLRSMLQGDRAGLDLNLPESIAYYREAETYFRELDQWRELGDVLELLGGTLYMSGKYDEGNQAFREAAKVFQLAGNQDRVADMLLAAGTSGVAQTLDVSMRDTLDVLEIYKASGNLVGEASVYQNMGYDSYEDIKQPIRLLKQAIEISEQVGDIWLKLSSMAGLAEIYAEDDQLENARQVIEEALSIQESSSNPEQDAHSFRVAGVIYTLSGGEYLPQAKAYLEQSMDLYHQMGDVEMESYVHLGLADYFLAVGKDEEALQSIDIALEFNKNESSDSYPGILRMKKEFLLEMGRFEEAVDVMEEYVEVVEEEWRSGEASKLEMIQKEYEAELKSGEIKLLEKESELKSEKIVWLEAERRQEERIRMFTVLVLLLTIAITLALFLLARTRQRAVKNAHSLNDQLTSQNDELMEANKRLKLINDQRNELLRFGAHDLKNPLASMVGSMQLLREGISTVDCPEKDEHLEVLDLALESGRFMGDLIHKIMDSQIAETRVEMLRPVKLDPARALGQIIEMNQVASNAKKIALETSIQTGFEIETDPYAFKEIADNLISNAIKYTPQGGVVKIVLEKLPEDRLKLLVSDTGPGIPEEEQAMLFRPFAKLSPKPTNGESSNGLGLSIAKTLIVALGGTIHFRNHSRGGAEFIVNIPRVLKAN